MSECFEEKDSLEVALYLKENGMNDSICDVFEGISSAYHICKVQ